MNHYKHFTIEEREKILFLRAQNKTISEPDLVTSIIRPSIPIVIKVLPFGKRCAKKLAILLDRI